MAQISHHLHASVRCVVRPAPSSTSLTESECKVQRYSGTPKSPSWPVHADMDEQANALSCLYAIIGLHQQSGSRRCTRCALQPSIPAMKSLTGRPHPVHCSTDLPTSAHCHFVGCGSHQDSPGNIQAGWPPSEAIHKTRTCTCICKTLPSLEAVSPLDRRLTLRQSIRQEAYLKRASSSPQQA